MSDAALIHPNGFRCMSLPAQIQTWRGHGTISTSAAMVPTGTSRFSMSHHRFRNRCQKPIGQVCHANRVSKEA